MKGELVPSVAGGTGAAGDSAGPIQRETGSFLAAGPWRRIVIAAFGPVFNLAFALVVFAVIWWAGFSVPSPDNRVILATDYTLDSFAKQLPAAAAGLKTGDRVTAIDGVPVDKFQDILEMVTVAPGRVLRMTIQPAAASAGDRGHCQSRLSWTRTPALAGSGSTHGLIRLSKRFSRGAPRPLRGCARETGSSRPEIARCATAWTWNRRWRIGPQSSA